MIQQELRDAIWDELPPLRKHILGRQRIDNVITLAIEQCPDDLFRHVEHNDGQQDVVLAAWKSAVKRRYCIAYEGDGVQFGPLFWIILSPLIQYVIKRLLEWWLESSSHRLLLAGWKRELAT